MKWTSFQSMSWVFDFAFKDRLVNVQNRGAAPDLWVETFAPGKRLSLQVPGILRSNDWIHCAVVIKPTELKLYLNGFLLSDRVVEEPDTFRASEFSRSNSLGRSNAKVVWEDDRDFHGRIAEVRVWSQARTEGQILTNTMAKLTGQEPGLLAFYNFADPTQPGRDATGHGHDGKLMGNARIVAAQLPGSASSALVEKVIELDGTSSFVELPPNIFNDLDEATVEAWVKWRSFPADNTARFFSYGELYHDTGIQAEDNGTLDYFISEGQGQVRNVAVPVLLKTNEWYHIAAVSGKRGMKLYFNGVETVTNSHSGSFSAIKNGARFRLGRSVVDREPYVNGQLDEVRVWRAVRSEGEIRENMLKTLTGDEPGLAGYWNFNDGTAKDSSPGRHNGTLQGNAKVVAGRQSAAQEFFIPAMITGKVTDAEGRPLRNADVVLLQKWSGGDQNPVEHSGGIPAAGAQAKQPSLRTACHQGESCQRDQWPQSGWRR